MAIVNTLMTFDSINVSAQVGDIAYCSPIGMVVGFDTLSTSTTIKLGEILAIDAYSITVEYDTVPLPPLLGSFVFFVKNHVANTSSLLGYYANAKFENNSKVKHAF